jgi:putative ABC transport system permease protein
MLSVKNLKKTYIPKNGQPVSALDDINVDFQEKGLVFILGKSGSGKSTLLNLIGGLDSPTSGEIIIKGKSSKDFKRADFDSYRNTFMGFVFQEYYILEKFTVAQNIGIALELSQEKADLETINQILDAVDLSGYADRMPNELSGGQKQRVAIARAIIKNPRIVLADEPTGSLDSATGEMIFETLKRLSAQRLVIVVSHDR